MTTSSMSSKGTLILFNLYYVDRWAFLGHSELLLAACVEPGYEMAAKETESERNSGRGVYAHHAEFPVRSGHQKNSRRGGG